MMRIRRERRRDESGAVAVMFAILSIVLFSAAALSVDLGNAFQTKQLQQKNVDFATLAGIQGNDLPGTVSGTCSYGNRANPSDQAIIDVANEMTTSGTTVTPAQLTDCTVTKASPEAVYGTLKIVSGNLTETYNKNQLTVITTGSAGTGFGRIMGINNISFSTSATGEIRSPQLSTLPFYAFSGCDYGTQTLAQPNNGHSSDPIMLYAPGDNYNATLSSVTPTSYPAGTPSGTLQPIDISGSNFTGITDVGFFEPGNGVAGPAPVTAVATGTPFTVSADGKTIHFNDLPDATKGVTGVQEFWYIRVKGPNGQWSSINTAQQNPGFNAPMLTIGSPPLICGQGSSSGNFGTLLLAHNPYTGSDKTGAANVAIGLTNTLAQFPTTPTPPADGTCTGTTQGAVLWGPNGTDGTNCVDTDTGMSSNVATGGFLGVGSAATGTGDYLLKPRGKTKCGPGQTEATNVIMGVTVNNDTLTCFFLNGSTHVADVDNSAYAGAPLISVDIYSSPRFAYVPVLPVQPANGGSNKYQIIDFRPCFITDQPGTATKNDGPGSGNNGIQTDNNSVSSVQVVFLNNNALPPPPGSKTVGYVGTGIKIPQLVN